MTRPVRSRSRQLADQVGGLVRSWEGPVFVRAAGSPEERVIEGIAVPFGVVATVRDSPTGPAYQETIERSALDDVDPTRVLLDYVTDPPRTHNSHEGSRLVGRGFAGESTDEGYLFAARVARTANGDELLGLARDGVLTDMSVYFTPREHVTRPDGVVARTGIDLTRVTIVPRGAYQGATVTAVRSATEGTMHCQHCGAALVAGVAHTCPNARRQAAPGRGRTAAAPPADPPADDDDENTDQAAGAGATPPPAGDARPNRTRVTVDVERASNDQLLAELGRRSLGANDDRARSAAERGTVDDLSRNAGRRGPAYVTREEPIYGPGTERSFFADAFHASPLGGMDQEAQGRINRHYAMLADLDVAMQRAGAGFPGALARAGDVLSSEIPGAYPNEYLPGLIVNRVLKQRPMGGFYDRFPLADGRPRIYPVVTTSTSVAAQGAEGSNPAASDFATTGTTVTPVFYGGETKVSRQVLDGADPSTDSMLQTDLNEAYMQASEAIIRAAVEAGSTASGVALTAATPDAGLRLLVANHLGNVFLPAERLFLPTTIAASWLAQNDTTGRPLAPAYNPMNASGVADPNNLPIIGQVLSVPTAQSWSSTAGAGAGVGGVAVIGRSSDFAIFESNLVDFQFTQGAEAPAAIRVGIWAYLVVGTRRGSRKATGA